MREIRAEELSFWVRIYFSHQTSLLLLQRDPDTQTYLRPRACACSYTAEMKSKILIRKNITNQIKFSIHLINHFPFKDFRKLKHTQEFLKSKGCYSSKRHMYKT